MHSGEKKKQTKKRQTLSSMGCPSQGTQIWRCCSHHGIVARKRNIIRTDSTGESVSDDDDELGGSRRGERANSYCREPLRR